MRYTIFDLTTNVVDVLPVNPIDVLFGAYRRQILKLLLRRPEEYFHVREIERLTGVPAGSLHRELKPLVESGVLLRQPLGNLVRYRANQNCKIFPALTAIFSDVETAESYPHISAGGLRVAEPAPASYAVARNTSAGALRALQRLKVSRRAVGDFCRRHHLKKLSFFGSITREDFRPDSDVDVMLEFEPGHKADLLALSGLRDELSALFDGRSVDVITNAPIPNPFVRETIMRDLQTVYAAH
jgi:predicted nucleotidyltransferase